MERTDATVTVNYVYDGDTVKLQDGRRLRFIGINTPEIDHDGGDSEPFSREARERLERMIGERPIHLRYGKELHDRYGRLLAHPYLADGRSINVALLQEGLATTLVVPPNTWNYACYQSVERSAQEKKMGIWSLARYRPVRVGDLSRDEPGYRLVDGVIEAVFESRNSIWLELVGPMALRIPRKDLPYFSTWNLDQLVGRRIVARGWPHLRKGKWRMSVRHPSALQIADD